MTRLNVNINDETAAAIRQIMERHGWTATEVVRRSVSVYALLHRAQQRGHIEIAETENGTVTRVVIL